MQSGAVGAVSEKIATATGVTNHNTRHRWSPPATPTHAEPHRRSLRARPRLRGCGCRMFGLGRITTAQMEDFAGFGAASFAAKRSSAMTARPGSPCSTSTPAQGAPPAGDQCLRPRDTETWRTGIDQVICTPSSPRRRLDDASTR